MRINALLACLETEGSVWEGSGGKERKIDRNLPPYLRVIL